MSSSLASLLTNAVAKDPDAPALRLDDVVMTYGQLEDGSRRVAGMLARAGSVLGTASGSCSLTSRTSRSSTTGSCVRVVSFVPMNVLLKGRETAFYLSDPEAKAVFAWKDFAEAAQTGADEAGAECIVVDPVGFLGVLAETEPADAEPVPRRGHRHRGDPLHIGHHGHPQGRRAHA